MAHNIKIIKAGKRLEEAKKALVLVHGRGGTAEDILSVSADLQVDDFSLFAPQAPNNSWYPHSFLAAPAENEPALGSALQVLADIVKELEAGGISKENIYFLGFSQGACLTLEFATRNATRYGGIAAFTGGLIGDKIYPDNYHGNFAGTPVFIGTGNPDSHVPVKRVVETYVLLEEMNAAVTYKIYDNMGHTINQDEIIQVNKLLFNTTQLSK